jgi:hypothetical protein
MFYNLVIPIIIVAHAKRVLPHAMNPCATLANQNVKLVESMISLKYYSIDVISEA